MLDPLVLSAVTLTNLHKARKHFEKMERVDSPSMVSLCIEFCQMFFLRMLNCLLLPTSFFFFLIFMMSWLWSGLWNACFLLLSGKKLHGVVRMQPGAGIIKEELPDRSYGCRRVQLLLEWWKKWGGSVRNKYLDFFLFLPSNLQSLPLFKANNNGTPGDAVYKGQSSRA